MAKGLSTQSVCGMLGPVGTAGGSLADTARLDTHMALSPLTCPRHNMEQKAHTGEDSQPCSQHRLLQRKSRCTSLRKETPATFSVCPSAAAGPARNVPSGVSLGSEGYFFSVPPKDIFIDWRERAQHQCERETSIDCLPHRLPGSNPQPRCAP